MRSRIVASAQTASMYSASTADAVDSLASIVRMLKFTAPVARLACNSAGSVSLKRERRSSAETSPYHQKDEELVVVHALEQHGYSRQHAASQSHTVSVVSRQRGRAVWTCQTTWMAAYAPSRNTVSASTHSTYDRFTCSKGNGIRERFAWLPRNDACQAKLTIRRDGRDTRRTDMYVASTSRAAAVNSVATIQRKFRSALPPLLST
jgi:hypothetical protein